MPRSKQAERMGFAWVPEELGDMTYDEAVKIISVHESAAAEGQLCNEDTSTIEYARRRIAHISLNPN